MEIRFKDKLLRELCEKKAVAAKKLGDVCARKLQTRLADIAAASRVTDLVAGKPHPLKGDRHGQFALEFVNTSQNNQAQVRIINISGKVVSEQKIGISNGSNTIHMRQLSNAPNGLYQIDLVIGNEIYSTKIVRQ